MVQLIEVKGCEVQKGDILYSHRTNVLTNVVEVNKYDIHAIHTTEDMEDINYVFTTASIQHKLIIIPQNVIDMALACL